MADVTVRISEAARETLRELASNAHLSMQEILERALEEYRRKTFLEQVNAGYAVMTEDGAAWHEFQAELASWDATLGDGLDESEKKTR